MEVNQNIPVNIEIPATTNSFKILSQNNLESVYCTAKNALWDLYIRTNSGATVDNRQIEMYFNGQQHFEYVKLNIPITDGINIDNFSNQEVSCTFLVNNIEENFIQKQVQDYWLSIINFLVIILIFLSPFIYFWIIVREKNKKNTLIDNPPKNDK